MSDIARTLGVTRFILYGGAPVDLLLNGKSSLKDLDIGILSQNEAVISKCKNNIEERGFKIIEPYREYYIHLDEKVILVYAKSRKWFLDIAFLNDIESLGHFNFDTLYFRYPENDYVDKFGALKAVQRKKIRLVRDIKQENPFLLMGRFLRLCTKYHLDLGMPRHRKILVNLKAEMKIFKMDRGFHREAYTSCLSSLMRSILGATDRVAFLDILIKEGILGLIIPELEGISFASIFSKKIVTVASKADLAVLFLNCLKTEDAKSLFREKMKLISLRKWDPEDEKCYRVLSAS